MAKANEVKRMCCGCRKIKPKSELIRIVKLQDGDNTKKVNIEIDKTFKKQGRGTYLCKDEKCLKTAIKKKSINRGLRCNVPNEIYECLEEELKENE